jgi:MSHA pilin protein MshD
MLPAFAFQARVTSMLAKLLTNVKKSASGSFYKSKPQSGFTLIELIVGIVVFSVALVMLTSVIIPQTRKGIDPIWQVRALTLGQSLLSEISSKAFDENSITNNGRQACASCSSSSNLGADAGETRANFDDIDDYNGLILSGVDISNTNQATLSTDTADLFLGFEAQIRVFYDANYDGINDDDTDQDNTLDTGTLTANQKLLEVTIITPDGERIPFSTYRNNF